MNHHFYFKLQLTFRRMATISYWLMNFLESKELTMVQYLQLVTAPLLKPTLTPALLKLLREKEAMSPGPWGF